VFVGNITESVIGAMLRSVYAALGIASGLLDQLVRNRALRALGFLAWMVFVVLGTATLSLDDGGLDYWQHLAAVRALSSNPADPPPLYFTEPYQVYLYTPYHIFWATIRALFSVDIWTVAILMAAVNAAIFALGARLLAKHIIHDPDLGFATLVTLLTFWYQPVWWRGLYSLSQIAPQAMCSSFFALGLSMIVASLWMEERYRSPSWCVALTMLAATVLTSHPVTGGFLILFLAIKRIVFTPLTWRARIVGGLLLVVGLTLAGVWPYYSLQELINSAGVALGQSGDFGAFYRNVSEPAGPELLGVVALPLISDRRLRLFLLAMLGTTLAVHASDYFLRLPFVFSRYLIYLTFVLHLCVVAALASVRRRVWGLVVVGAFLAIAGYGGYSQLRTTSRYSSSLVRDLREGERVGTNSVATRYRDLANLEPPQAGRSPVIMAPLDWAYRVSALTDYKVVGVRHPAPTMPDFEGRRRDVWIFYDPETERATRDEILRRREAGYVLVPLDSETGDPLLRLPLDLIVEGSNFALYRVPPREGDSPSRAGG
jgi:hypothetical protein